MGVVQRRQPFPGDGRANSDGEDEPEPLTLREREILGCFADGLDTRAIATRLGIAAVTVRNHAQKILSKLRVHSRLAAVARGRREGLIVAEHRSGAAGDGA